MLLLWLLTHQKDRATLNGTERSYKCYQLYMYWQMWPPRKRSIITQETVLYITNMASFIEELGLIEKAVFF